MLGYALAPFSAVYLSRVGAAGLGPVVAAALPMTYIFEGMRRSSGGGPLPLRPCAGSASA